MKKEYTISVFTENHVGVLHRVSVIFTRRHINIESITASESEVKGIYRYTVVIIEDEEKVIKIVKQLEKQVDIVKAFYHSNDQMVYQELALYKVPTTLLATGGQVEKLVRSHHARILTMEPQFTILEKAGYPEDIVALFDALSPYGLLEFVRSGRVAISKPMKEFKDFMAEVEAASHR